MVAIHSFLAEKAAKRDHLISHKSLQDDLLVKMDEEFSTREFANLSS